MPDRAAIQRRLRPEGDAGPHPRYSLPMLASPASLAGSGSLRFVLGEHRLARLAPRIQVGKLHSRNIDDSANRDGRNMRLRLKVGLHLCRCDASTLLFDLNRQHQSERPKVARAGPCISESLVEVVAREGRVGVRNEKSEGGPVGRRKPRESRPLATKVEGAAGQTGAAETRLPQRPRRGRP